jgi:uncharacterized protein YjeT (DUF2065 family)
MRRTRLSFYYLMAYLNFAGLALLLAPQLTLKLLFATGSYGDVMPRLVGMFVLVLGILVIQIFRLRVEALYTTVLGVRVGILVVLLGLFLYAGDPLFITLLVVVGFGVALTSAAYRLDRKDQMAMPQKAT